MTGERNYYDILGVPRTASLDDIKKRYRELARQHHPDVNRNKPDAAKLFAEITKAYKTLSHPDERATYDADMALRERRAAAGAARAAANNFPGTAPPPPRSGTGRPAGTNGRATGAPGGATPPPRTSTPRPDTARLISQAQAAFVRGKFVEARALCEQVLRHDRRNAQAHEILGDVYRLQGRTEDAINMYTMALQLNPRNHTVMERLERLARTGSREQTAFFDYNATRGMSPGRRPIRDKRPLKTLLGGVIGYGLVMMSILYLAMMPPQKQLSESLLFLGPLATWSIPLLVVMVFAGLVLGFTMAATAAIRRIDDEMILTGVRGGQRGAHLPLGLLLLIVSVLSFYAAALLYGIIAFLQESLTPSILRIFGAVLVVVLLLTAVYEPGRREVFLFGGNVVFLAYLVGWAMGDCFRPDGY